MSVYDAASLQLARQVGITLASYGGKLVAVKKGSTLEYVHTDHLGSVNRTTATSGALVRSEDDFPYGSVRAESGIAPTDRSFTGQRRDSTGLLFYIGKIKYKGRLYQGEHESMVPVELWEQVQAMKQLRPRVRKVHGHKGILQGIVYCVRCASSVQSDRHRFGAPMYRERHSKECITNERSIMAHVLDGQIEDIMTSISLRPDWIGRMAKITVVRNDGPSLESLKEQKRRLSRGYADGGFSDAEYGAKMAEINRRIQQSLCLSLPTHQEAADLFQHVENLWKEATPEERRKLMEPLIERVFVDIEGKAISAIVPSASFRSLLGMR